jgi:hypothetical protein
MPASPACSPPPSVQPSHAATPPALTGVSACSVCKRPIDGDHEYLCERCYSRPDPYGIFSLPEPVVVDRNGQTAEQRHAWNGKWNRVRRHECLGGKLGNGRDGGGVFLCRAELYGCPCGGNNRNSRDNNDNGAKRSQSLHRNPLIHRSNTCAATPGTLRQHHSTGIRESAEQARACCPVCCPLTTFGV